MSSTYHNLSIQQLTERLSKCVQNAESNLIEASRILAELKRRGETHPFMTRGLFKWFEQIDAGSLDPALVVKFAGEDQIISRLVGLTVAQQRKIAETGEVKVVEERKGEIVEVEKPIIRMNLDQLNQVFDNGRIRTFAQQTKILKSAKNVAVKPRNKIDADVATGVLMVYGHAVEPNALIEPLRKLGYKLERKL